MNLILKVIMKVQMIMYGEMVVFAIPLILSLILYICDKHKIIGVLCGFASLVAGIFFIYQTNTIQNKEMNEFYLPFFAYKLSYEMSRSEINNILINNDEKILYSSDSRKIYIQKEWGGVDGQIAFVFNENQKLYLIYWVENKEDMFNPIEIKKLIIKKLQDAYGSKHKYKKKGQYYWENTENFAVLFTADTEKYNILWYEPDYFYKNIDIEKKIDISAED